MRPCLEVDLLEGNAKAVQATLHTNKGRGADGQSCNQDGWCALRPSPTGWRECCFSAACFRPPSLAVAHTLRCNAPELPTPASAQPTPRNNQPPEPAVCRSSHTLLESALRFLLRGAAGATLASSPPESTAQAPVQIGRSTRHGHSMSRPLSPRPSSHRL